MVGSRLLGDEAQDSYMHGMRFLYVIDDSLNTRSRTQGGFPLMSFVLGVPRYLSLPMSSSSGRSQVFILY